MHLEGKYKMRLEGIIGGTGWSWWSEVFGRRGCFSGDLRGDYIWIRSMRQEYQVQRKYGHSLYKALMEQRWRSRETSQRQWSKKLFPPPWAPLTSGSRRHSTQLPTPAAKHHMVAVTDSWHSHRAHGVKVQGHGLPNRRRGDQRENSSLLSINYFSDGVLHFGLK